MPGGSVQTPKPRPMGTTAHLRRTRHPQSCRFRGGEGTCYTRFETSRTESVTLMLALLLIVGFIFISYYPLARLMRLSYRN